MTTPEYQASTRLFVSTTGGQSMSDMYNGNRLSQDRVLSYTELIKGQTVAQRTIDKLNLNFMFIQQYSKCFTIRLNGTKFAS
jgi:receptor protein-tyrosine kinase